jgi:hypothetical protein
VPPEYITTQQQQQQQQQQCGSSSSGGGGGSGVSWQVLDDMSALAQLTTTAADMYQLVRFFSALLWLALHSLTPATGFLAGVVCGFLHVHCSTHEEVQNVVQVAGHRHAGLCMRMQPFLSSSFSHPPSHPSPCVHLTLAVHHARSAPLPTPRA